MRCCNGSSLLIAATVCMGCGDALAPDENPFTPEAIAGTYVARGVDGHALPHTVLFPEDECWLTAHSGSATLQADATWSGSLTMESCEFPITTFAQYGTYVLVAPDTVRFSADPDFGWLSISGDAILRGGHLTFDVLGVVWDIVKEG